MDFLWHKVSESEKEKIRKQARDIMDGFSSTLKGIKNLSKLEEEPLIERPEGERNEKQGESLEIDKEIMFENAPKKNKDFIVAEKKSW